ncbi:MAG TPA: ribonucleotide-diphosphate reductase subunit beta, partial [Pararobbsia sp.]|nr:ribonucleotide-diphosphate reductase subunit beta [Pararobbsia sp.]
MLNWDDEITAVTPASGEQSNALHAPAGAAVAPRTATTLVAAQHVSLAQDIFARDIPTPPSQSTVSHSDHAPTERVNVADKRIINGTTDVNQLVPFKYKWAWE